MNDRRMLIALLVALLVAPGLAACASLAPAPARRAAPPHAAPSAPPAAIHPWLVRDLAPTLAALAPLSERLPEPPPPPADPTALAAWSEPASVWVEAELRSIAAESLPPTRAARGLMLLGVAMSDGLAVADAARAAGLPVSDSAVVGAAALDVLTALHPLRAAVFAADAEAGMWAGLWRGDDSVAGVLNGRQLGQGVAAAVLAWAAADGADGLPPNVALPIASPGTWAPTPPQYDLPQEPAWGTVRTVAIGDPATLRAPAPPAWRSQEMGDQLAQFLAAQRELSDEDRAAARFWAAGMGTVTPPGMWAERARGLVLRDELPLRAAAPVYAALGIALHDAAVACWETKYHFWVARPAQPMAELDPAWAPLIRTPPHPSYPSGHAGFSGAAAELLAAFFPADAEALAAEAEAAARSRVLGGIHWPMDGEAGLRQGRAVAGRVLAARAAP